MKNLTTLDKELSLIEPLVTSFVSYRVSDREDARDIVQEIMMKIWRGSIEASRNPTGWIHTVSRTTIIDFWRSRKIKPVLLSLDVVDTYRIRETEETYDPAVTIDTGAIIDELLSCLNEKTRQTIVLRAQGATYKEIAESTDTCIGSVRSQIHYGRIRLRQKMESIGN
ncbi:MAG: sigma-70 family RNA polymerase sigma factor [Anaerolineae bacterium]|nr:sigma-70 family RNA polymerase sigma factor [Anaerolineae bacterium]